MRKAILHRLAVAVAASVLASVLAAAPAAAQSGPPPFSDVPEGAYYTTPVVELAAAGVFAGTECGAGFCPGGPIDRKTMAVWTVRVLDGADPPAVSESRFDDVDAAGFHARFIERMAELGVTGGCGDGTNFCPERVVTRAQMAVFLSRAFDLPAGSDPGFADVADDAWYASGVAKLAASGITAGCGDGTNFCPSRDTTRAQMATFLHRGLGWAADREAAAVAASRAELSAVPGQATLIPHLGRVTVSWPATAALAGSPVAGYEVQWRARGEAWDPTRRAVVIGLSFEVGGLVGGVHEVRVRRAIVEMAEAAGASIVAAEDTAPTAALVAAPVAIDEASNVSAFDGVMHFEMTGEPVWPATIELPVDIAKIEDDDFIFLMSFNEEHQIWLPEPGAVFDRERGVVTAEVYHLSPWFNKKVTGIRSGVLKGVSAGVSTIREVRRNVVDTVVVGTEVIVKPVANTIDTAIDTGAAVTTYVWDRTSSGVVYVAEKGRAFVVETHAASRDAALAAAQATWEATKFAAAVGWDAFVELVEGWVDRFTLTRPTCSDTEPAWVTGIETPEPGAPLIVCPEAVGVQGEQDLRLKATSWRHYPMLLTARDAASSKIKISSNNTDSQRIGIEQTEGSSTQADVIVAWFDAAFDTGKPVLPAGATHWLRIPRSALNNSPSMTLEGMYDGSAANLNTVFMGGDVLADIFGIPIGSGDISQLHSLSNEASKCFAVGYTTTSTEEQRRRSFNETTTCLAPVYLEAFASKTLKLLLSPVILLLEAIIQLAGYLEALDDIATGQDTPTTKVHVAPSDDNPQPDDPTPTTETTTANNSFTAVSASGSYSCGLRTNGAITCWGNNNLGQTNAPSGSFTAVSASSFYSCGLRTNGAITCWGYNNLGQTNAPSGSFTAVSAGGRHSCGLRTNGAITCWGNNYRGQTNAPSGSFTAVSASDWHSCGLRTNGAITCWGNNNLGQTNAPSGSFTAVSASSFYSCGLRTNGAITCWGYNNLGQTNAPSGSFTAVSAGGRHSCGLRTNGAITCWGYNSDGQTDAPSGSFTAVSASDLHSCGLRTNGAITCWGYNNLGQTDAPSGSFTAVSASDWHSCGLRTNGAITCWGYNSDGQTDAPDLGVWRVIVSKGGPGPTSLSPGQGLPCAPNTPTCRYIDVELSGFDAGTYTVGCNHDGWGDFGPSTFWTFSITVDASGSASSDGPCFLNFARLTGNGAYVTVSRTGTDAVASNWLK